MITATTNKNQIFKVNGLVNRGGYFGKTWLIGIQMGYEQSMFVIEADNEQDALDLFTDSQYGHLIKTKDLCKYHKMLDDGLISQHEFWNNCTCEFAGNYSDRVNLENVYFYGLVKVNYFAKKE